MVVWVNMIDESGEMVDPQITLTELQYRKEHYLFVYHSLPTFLQLFITGTKEFGSVDQCEKENPVFH